MIPCTFFSPLLHLYLAFFYSSSSSFSYPSPQPPTRIFRVLASPPSISLSAFLPNDKSQICIYSDFFGMEQVNAMYYCEIHQLRLLCLRTSFAFGYITCPLTSIYTVLYLLRSRCCSCSGVQINADYEFNKVALVLLGIGIMGLCR